MPISVTVPVSSPPIAPARSTIWSPARNGLASSSTIPANTLDIACCAAIPTITLVSTPPRSSWLTGTWNSASVMASVANPPISSRKYLTTAACAVPIRGSSTERALRDSP